MNNTPSNKIYRAIGLMSGTAMDGIDAALIETDGHNHVRHIGFTSCDHDPELRSRLKAQMNKIDYDPTVERDFTLAQIPVIQNLLSQTGYKESDIDVIGFHGQSTHHDPDQGITVQMGDGQLLANETGINVVYDLRSNDMKYGGQGAPLIPIYHRALIQNANIGLPIAILNLGGVGNITYIDDDNLIGFDTGPANALIDDWISKHTDQTFDKNGDIASQGTVEQSIVDDFLSLPYFEKPYPKSLDRNDFDKISVEHLSLEDGAATLTEMTIQSVAKSLQLLPQKPNTIYVTGGGRLNTYMMDRMSHSTQIPFKNIDELGWNGDAIEAEGFAYMAVRSLLNEPISFPNTTGCSQAVSGGVHVSPQRKCA